MAYKYTNSKGRTYYLHSKMVELKGGSSHPVYYFAREAGEDALEAIPTGYMVHETKNGLPVLKKVG